MADTNARLAALEQRCSAMEAQMRIRNAQVIDAFRKAISVLEASSTFGNAVDESGMLTAVDNSPSSELALKAVASNMADSATNLKYNTTPFMLDDGHSALKRRRTMADPRSMNRERADPVPTDLANPRQRSLSIASNESGELGDEIPLFPDNERSQRMRHGDKVSGTSRRDQQQLESNNGARGAALNDCRRQDGASSRAGHRPQEQERSPDSTFVDNAATPRGNSRGGRREQSDGHKDARNQSRHRSQERGVRQRNSYSRSPSRHHSSRRQSHGYNQGRSRSRSHSRSRNPTRSGSPYRNWHHDRRQYQERQNSPPPMEKPYLTGSNADPVPPGGPRRGRHNANRTPSPSARPSPQKNPEGAKQKSKRGVVTWEFDSGSKHISGRVDKNADNNWGGLEPAEASGNRLAGWDIGSPKLEAPKSGTKGWDTDSPVLDNTGPTMPRSINQLTSKVEPISLIEKVAAWKGADLTAVAARAPPYGPEDAVKAALSDCGSDDLGDKARASSYAISDRLYEDNIGSDDDDDDDDGDDDPRMLLKSKKRRAEIIVSMLNDSGGHQLTSERLAPLWKIFAWIPLDTLPHIYRRVYGIDLWTLETKKQIRASIKYLPGLSERSSMDGHCRQALIFRDKCHLKQPRAYQRLFVMSPACEAVLFFFLVTTILQPLDEQQAKTVANLWVDEFGKGPTHAVTTVQARGSATTKWESDEVVWKSAIQWLGQLAKITMQHGKDYLTGKTTNWDNVGLSSRKDRQAAPHDPERELMAGLLKDELVELLKATPTLLSKILPEDKLRVLKSEVG
ncbi:hypothetical protein GGH93_001560 [Coemansia aciculifera]|nr:hypothetical protein GGH93_001560 [Coemansia aciculifera]